MVDLQPYMSDRWGQEFARRLPALRKQLGVQPWNLGNTNFGVSGNTFRAFRVRRYRPSDLYQDWARRQSDRLDSDALALRISTYPGFVAWHASLQSSLGRYWRKWQGEPLSAAHRRKLIDLYVKWLSRHDLGHPPLTSAFEANAHCAIDSQVLQAINICYSQALPLRNPSMSHVDAEITYQFRQELIRAFANRYGGTNLLFDYFAWAKGGSQIVRRKRRTKGRRTT